MIMSDLDKINFGNVNITLTPPNSPQSIGLALLNNRPFPDDAFVEEAISLGSIKASASKDFKVDKVTFVASGGAFAGFGVYRSGSKLLDALKAEGLDEPMVTRLEFPDDATRNLVALRWGYEAKGSINGAVAFGPTVTFGASGRREALYALVRSFDRNARSFDSLTDTVSSWKMPRQVSKPSDLQPGTWVISETEGEIKLSLGLSYGYNYNWVRESLQLGGLTGDIGLKIEMGVKAQLGFNASGRYALVIARESESESLRVQIFRLKEHGWSFAFDATLLAQVKQNLIPDNFDDFVKGVFNVNGLQALNDIGREFNKWTNPNNKLKDLLGAELVNYAKGLVKKVTDFDPDTDIDKALERLRKPIELWQSLPHEITSVLYDVLRKATPLDELRAFLQRVVDLTDPDELTGEITERLREVAFFETTIGKWITAAAEKGILTLLANVTDERERLAELAQKTLDLLDGDVVEDTLRKLQGWIEEKLGLDKILALTDTNFAEIDAWLKKRLSDFLGKSVVIAELEKIKAAINHLREKAKEFYAKGYEALMEKYKAEFHYSYQKTTTRTALIDVTFDFAVDVQSAQTHFAQALSGDFNTLLSKQLPGVKLNKGVLTHEIKRRSHLEVNLPYFSSTLDHINNSIAKGEAVDAKDGRLWIFNLEAMDVVSKKTSMSKLSIAMQLTKNAGVRQFSKEEYNYNYKLRLTKRDARREYMEDKLQVLVNQYLASEFLSPGKEPFSTYLTALDKALDAKGVGGDDRFGNILIGFDVSLPSQVLAAWKKVPVEDKDEKYMLMSQRVQNVLRRLIPLCYIRDLEQYDEIGAIYPLLAYCALPPINRVELSGGKLKFTQKKVLEWDYRDSNLRDEVFKQYCAPKLENDILPRVRLALRNRPGTQAKYTNAKKILSLNTIAHATRNFESLMISESDLITGIHKAGKQFRKFLNVDKFEEALKELAGFGAKLTDSFNNKVGNTIYEGSTLRPLGSLLFVEVGKVFDENLASKVQPTVMFELFVLRQQSTFVLEEFLKDKRPASTEVALQQRIVNVGTPNL
jgi:hypothetical protein